MAQLLVRKLPDEVKEKLRARAAANGHSLEEEARIILTESALGPSDDERTKSQAERDLEEIAQVGLGTWIAGLFAGCGFEEGEIPRISWRSERVPDFSE